VEKVRRTDSAKGHKRSSSVKSEVFRQVDENYGPTEVKLSILHLSNKHSDDP
jgi:hypothetical protein